MAGYDVFIKPSALKELESVDSRKLRRVIVERIESLGDDPRPLGCRKLVGGMDRFRLRCGVWRVVYLVEDDRRSVTVVKVGHRKDIYR